MEIRRNYYCSNKFKFLKIDLEKGTTYNCHAAAPHPIDFEWLKDNPGEIFNTTTNVNERKMMLRNERNPSCEQNCWPAEDIGAISPRLFQKGNVVTHSNPISRPELIDMTVSSDCNLTCSYCCKEFSSAWRRDVLTNGDYSIQDGDRYQATNVDRIFLKLSQNERKHKKYQILIKEIEILSPTLTELNISGGEPFLDNKLIELLKKLKTNDNCKIIIYTGLGLTFNRFKRVLDNIKSLPNLEIRVSAECVGEYLEFNRYGVKWHEFLKKINYLISQNVNFGFHSTITNLTIFGFVEFCQTFKDHNIRLTFAYQPSFMSLHVLDVESKASIINSIQALPEQFRVEILKSLTESPTNEDKENIRSFLLEFVSRRPDLKISIYPMNFLKWLKVDHVV